jgi:ubiquinone/menaquinone biosynthesis C-methylase UbiE
VHQPIAQIGQKSRVIFNVTRRLKRGAPKAELKFSVMPQSQQPTFPRFLTHPSPIAVYVCILDVGCGKGNPPQKANLSVQDSILGINIRMESRKLAKQRYPTRQFICGKAEALPFSAKSFDRVVSAYTNIPLALA